MLGKIQGKRRKGHQRMRWLDISNAINMNLEASGDGEGQGGLVCLTGRLNNNNIENVEKFK